MFLLLNCQTTSNAVQDNEIKPYVNEFIRVGEIFNIKSIGFKTRAIEVRLGKAPDGALAVCHFYQSRIVIDRKAWNSLPPENREELVFHELGHCALGEIDHREDGIMRATGIYNPIFYRRFHRYLMKDLFNCTTRDCPKVDYNESIYKVYKKEKQVTKEDVLNNEHAVVRFTATWCPPCKALAPVFDELAAENPDVKTYVIDVDQNPDLARDLNVRGIPTCIAIRNNKIDQTLVGNQPKPELEKLFK